MENQNTDLTRTVRKGGQITQIGQEGQTTQIRDEGQITKIEQRENF